MQVAVSLTAHESELALLDQCFNYVYVGEVDMVVVHINPLSSFNTMLFLRLLNASPIREKIFLNCFSVNVPMVPEKMWTPPALHRPHLMNFQYLRALKSFDLFCLDASNTLLIKQDLRDFLRTGDAAEGGDISASWSWFSALSNDIASGFFRDALCMGQHEGTVYTFESFSRMYDEIIAYEKMLTDHIGAGGELAVYPREEVIFPSAYRKTCSRNTGPHSQERYIYMPWDRKLHWDIGEVEAILQGRGKLPDLKYGIKRIARDINDPVRALVGNHFGYRTQIHQLVDALKNGKRC